MAATDLNAVPTRTVTASCFCKAVHYSLALPTSVLPISAHMCHCSRCRYTHGTLCIFHVPLPAGITPQFHAPSSLQHSVTRYWFDGAVGDRRFCKTCGCHIGDYVESLNMWYIAPALFSKDESVFLIDEHIFTLSAPKGLYEWLPRIGDRLLRVTNPDDGSANPEVPEVLLTSDGEERLLCKCHCGGVSFTIKRPTSVDLGQTDIEHLIPGRDRMKWKAWLDASHESRLMNGVHIGTWMSVPLRACEPEIGPDLCVGSAVTFNPSPGKLCSFCSVCGATLLRIKHSPNADLDSLVVDISLGIARAPEGVRAESWVGWEVGAIEGIEQGLEYDKELFTSVKDGFCTRAP